MVTHFAGYRLDALRFDEVGAVPVLWPGAPQERAAFDAGKRVLDLTLGSVLLVAFAPVMALLAVAVRLDSPGPSIFTHERVGRGGRKFRMYKFRSMKVDSNPYADSPAGESDDRLTGIGEYAGHTAFTANETDRHLSIPLHPRRLRPAGASASASFVHWHQMGSRERTRQNR